MALTTLLIVPLSAAQEQPRTDLSALLRKVASTYAAITDYVIRVTMTSGGGPSPALSNGDSIADQHTSGSMPSAAGGFVPTPIRRPDIVNKILIARSGEAFHYDIKATATPPFAWITDGRVTWRYRGNRNEYTKEPASPWPEVAGPGRDLPGMEWRYFSKFRALGKMEGRAKLIKDDVRADSVCPGPTTLIELQIPNGDDGAVEQLRILHGNFLVCKSVVTRRLPPGAPRVIFQTIKTSWTYDQLSGPIDPKLFTFTPPRRAKRVKNAGAVNSYLRAVAQPG